MAVKTVDMTTGANHPIAQNLRGWCFQGTAVLRLRKKLVTGDVIAIIEDSQSELFADTIDAPEGTYVELVSGTLTEGVLYYN
jgi:hypothetical protein